MKKNSTNIEFVTELMNYGNPLKQAFIMEAIANYAKEFATDFDADKAEASGKWNFVSPHAWKACGVEIHKACEERFAK